MEQPASYIQQPTGKIFKDSEIHVATLLGGPLVAGYTIAENFKVFGEQDKAKQTWIYAIIATVIIFGIVFLIPDVEKIPRELIPLIYTAIAGLFVKQFQSKKIKAHLEAGGQIQKWGRTIVISLIGSVVTLILIVGIPTITNVDSSGLTTKSYGNIKNEISFDRHNIREKEVDTIANDLIKITFFDEARAKFILLKKVGNSYEISIPFDNQTWANPKAVAICHELQSNMQKLYDHNKIVVNMCENDDEYSVEKRIE